MKLIEALDILEGMYAYEEDVLSVKALAIAMDVIRNKIAEQTCEGLHKVKE